MAGRTTSSLPLFEFDRGYCGRGEIAGADEAGRGCLAGPLVSAAVVFDHTHLEPKQLAGPLQSLSDSKKLTRAARERIYPMIIRHASRFSVVVCGNRTIDADGLHRTNLRALAQSLKALGPCPLTALVDGRQKLPGGDLPHLPIPGGDAKSACIAAASVIAKVVRDRLMRSLHDSFPEYGFDRHVGYATREHRYAINAHGYSRLHRRSFKISIEPGSAGEG